MVSFEGYELILGSSIDPQFGPVILFGLGGQLVEVFKDSSLAIPPLNTTLAKRTMERTRIYSALKGVRGRKPIDLDELERLIVRFSTLISEQRWIKELDINPLLASPERILALDARIVVYSKDTQEKDLPELAIRPYPSQYVSEWTAKDGTRLIFRPVRAEDEPAMVDFHESLSDRSVYLRFLNPRRLSDRAKHDRLSRICHGDYGHEIALIVENPNAGPNDLKVIAASRMTRLHGDNAARFSLLASDRCQGLGIGTQLMTKLIECRFTPDNAAMRKILEKFGFIISGTENGLLRADLALK
jgi:acetyltransferase